MWSSYTYVKGTVHLNMKIHPHVVPSSIKALHVTLFQIFWSQISFAWRTPIETTCRCSNNQFISGWTRPSTFMLHLVTAGLKAGHCGIFFFFSRWQNALKNDARLLLTKAISACGSEGLQGRLWLSLYPCVLFEDLFFSCIDLNAYIPPQRRFL